MRILSLRFKNLNSLLGEWEIDFTLPAYSAEGIFAITGPTGAGKSTILDAMCLALYGRTPRLAAINQSANAILSYGASDCFAELTFATNKGTFRCHWGQNKAKKSGKLQKQKHEIVDAESGTVLENSLRPVADKVLEVIGMDFAQFTRSVLLAQGGFAAFLEAHPRDRAPLLEQITGTEIYSSISKYCHERKAREQQKLDALEAELGSTETLLPEEEAALNTQCAELSEKETELLREYEKNKECLFWLSSLGELEKELLSLEEDERHMQGRMEAFKQDAQRLALAEKALALDSAHTALSHLREERERGRELLDGLTRELPGISREVDRLQHEHDSFRATAEAGKEELALLRPLLQEVRELDLLTQTKQAFAKEQDCLLEKKRQALVALQNERTALQDLHRRKENEKATVQALLERSAKDATLSRDLVALREQHTALQKMLGLINAGRAERKQAKTALQQAHHEHLQAEAECQVQEQQHASLLAARNQTNASLSTLLDGQSLTACSKERDLLQNRMKSMEERILALKRRQAITHELHDLDGKAGVLQKKLESDVQTKEQHEQRLALLEQMLAEQEEHERLHDLRTALQDGVACPLCGSTDHPFTQSPLHDARICEQRAPSSIKRELAETRGQITALVAEQAAAQRDIAHLELERERLAKEEDAMQALLLRPAPDAAPPPLFSPASSLQEASTQLETMRSALQAAESRLAEMLKLDTQLREQDAALAAHTTLLHSTRQSMQQAAHAKALHGQRLEQFTREHDTAAVQAALARERLADSLRRFEPDLADNEDFGPVLQKLEVRGEKRTEYENRFADTEKELALCAERLALLHAHITSEEEALAQSEERARAAASEVSALQEKRQAIFGLRQPNQEEAALTGAIAETEKKLTLLQATLVAARTRQEQTRLRKEEVQKELQQREEALAPAAQAFSSRLHQAGFVDEQAYSSARLAEPIFSRLKAEAEALQQGKLELLSLLKEKQSALAALKDRKLTEKSLDELIREKATLEEQSRNVQLAIGAIQQKLRHNDSQKLLQAERLALLAAQKREHRRWSELHNLIGSADGAKYRTFAQGLTFSRLIARANRQLASLSDRYLLDKDDTEALEFSVIDNYQAGEKRTIKNLSGGESFIVSLALALGLAQMSGSGMRVDSLFLDEGFGTLDEDSLDTALETLSGLQQNGKTIGIISHVAALKERIPTSIQVTPQSGGKSRLDGPGCRLVNS